MTINESLTTEQALELHKKFLQNILQEVMKILETGDPSVDRMIRGLNTYWDANHQHSAARRRVQQALVGTPYESNAEPMGRPFLMMLRAELQADHVQNIDAISQQVYDEAREIALDEAMSGERKLDRREKLIAYIKTASRAKANT